MADEAARVLKEFFAARRALGRSTPEMPAMEMLPGDE